MMRRGRPQDGQELRLPASSNMSGDRTRRHAEVRLISSVRTSGSPSMSSPPWVIFPNEHPSLASRDQLSTIGPTTVVEPFPFDLSPRDRRFIRIHCCLPRQPLTRLNFSHTRIPSSAPSWPASCTCEPPSLKERRVRVVRKQRQLRRQARTGQNEARPVAQPVATNDGSNDGGSQSPRKTRCRLCGLIESETGAPGGFEAGKGTGHVSPAARAPWERRAPAIREPAASLSQPQTRDHLI